MNKNKLSHSWVMDLLGIALLLGIFYALWIGSHPLFTPDEGRYSEVAREMVATGDYVTPRLNGVAFLDKPVLYYWLQASAIKLFGLKEWALRFWPAFAGILGCIIIYLTGRVLFNRRTGIISALILATSPLYYGASHYANLDLEVASLVSNSLLCFIAAMQFSTGKRRDAFLIAAYVFAGLAFLTKGLIGIVFPAIIISTWIILLRRWNTFRKIHLISGLSLFLIIVLPWYILVQQANPAFLHFFFVTQQVSRFLTTVDFNNKATVWFYVPIVLVGFFPWSVFLLQAIATKLKNIWKNRQQHPIELYLLLWFFIVFIFFSIPRSKTIGYILPLFPCAALMVGSYLNNLWDKSQAQNFGRGVNVLIFLCCALGVILLSIGFLKVKFFGNFIPYLIISGATFLIAGLMSLLCSREENFTKLFSCITTMSVVVLITLASSLHVINHKSIKPLAVQLKNYLRPNDEVVTFYKYYQDLPIYLERRIVIVADWNSPEIPRSDNWVRELWYGMVFQDTKDWLIDKDTFWQRWNSNKRLFVLTDMDTFKQIKMQNKVYKLGQVDNTVLFSNRPVV